MSGPILLHRQLSKIFLHAGRPQQAERCLNNSSEHFIKLGNGAGEAGALRLLADLYEQRDDCLSAIRCLERIQHIGLTLRQPLSETEAARLARLRQKAAGK